MRQTYVRHSPELEAEVLRRLKAGESLRAVCRAPHMPSEGALRKWARKWPAFAAALDAARPGPRRGGWKGGRPPPNPGLCRYTDALAWQICEAIAEGASPAEIARDRGMPSPKTLRHWRRRFPEFDEMYADACQFRRMVWLDEAVEIADAAHTFAELRRARLRIGARMWLAQTCGPRGEARSGRHR